MVAVGISEIVAPHTVDRHENDVPSARRDRLGGERDRENEEKQCRRADAGLHQGEDSNMDPEVSAAGSALIPLSAMR